MFNLNMNLPCAVMRLSVKLSFVWNKYSIGLPDLAHKLFVTCVTHLLVEPTKSHKQITFIQITFNFINYLSERNCNGIGHIGFWVNYYSLYPLVFTVLRVKFFKTPPTDVCWQHCQKPKTSIWVVNLVNLFFNQIVPDIHQNVKQSGCV